MHHDYLPVLGEGGTEERIGHVSVVGLGKGRLGAAKLRRETRPSHIKAL